MVLSLEPIPAKLEYPELMTAKEIAQYLRIPLPTVYCLLYKGQLPGIRIGNRWRIKKSIVDKSVLKKDTENDWKKPKNNGKKALSAGDHTSISVVFDDQLLGSLVTNAITGINRADTLAVHDRIVSYVDFIMTDRDMGYVGALPLEFAGRVIRIIPDENLRQGETSDTPITEVTSLELGKNPAEVLRKLLKLKS